MLLVLSGLVLWKSVQFPLLRELLGGYEGARRVHFVAMAALLSFVAGARGDGGAGPAHAADHAARPLTRGRPMKPRAPIANPNVDAARVVREALGC